MVLLHLAVVCLSALLPLCAESSQDPLIWATVEAQGAYIIGDAAQGGKCTALPNTFEMRADGAWLPASEYDLTGNFDEDCGIHVTLSIPSDSFDPGAVITETTAEEKKKQKYEEDKKKIEAEKKELEEGKKKLEEEKKGLVEAEGVLASEKEAHLKKMEESKKENEATDEAKKKVEEEEAEMKKKEEALKEKVDALMKKKDEIAKRREALESEKTLLSEDSEKQALESDAYKSENEEVLKKMKDYETEKDRLEKLYNRCNLLPIDYLFLVPDYEGTKKLCSVKEDTNFPSS